MRYRIWRTAHHLGHMHEEHQRGASEPILIELIEADVDMAFGLVDDGLDELRAGNLRSSTYVRDCVLM